MLVTSNAMEDVIDQLLLVIPPAVMDMIKQIVVMNIMFLPHMLIGDTRIMVGHFRLSNFNVLFI